MKKTKSFASIIFAICFLACILSSCSMRNHSQQSETEILNSVQTQPETEAPQTSEIVATSIPATEATEMSAEPPRTNYEAFKELIIEYEEKHGELNYTYQQNSSWTDIRGLCFLKLVDFDKNGIEELVLIYEDPTESNLRFLEYTFEIWECLEGELRLLDSGKPLIIYEEIPYILLTDYEDKTYLVSGKSDIYKYYNYHGYIENDGFEIAMSSSKLPGDNGDEFKVNDRVVTEEEYFNFENQMNDFYFISLSNDYDGDIDEVIRAVKEVKEKLGIPINEPPVPELPEILTGIWFNGEYEWALNYHITFEPDGKVEIKGYRNQDRGTYKAVDDHTIEATFDECLYDSPGSGYNDMNISYTCTFRYDHETKQLLLSFTGGTFDWSNNTEGYFTKVDDYVPSA